jgi:hypothetical protein
VALVGLGIAVLGVAAFAFAAVRAFGVDPYESGWYFER